MTDSTQAAPTATPSIDPKVFLDENRIHVKDGSLFISPNLVLHRRELDPANEPALRKKLERVFTLHQPSYFDSKPEQAMGVNLGQLVPVSLKATHSNLTHAIADYNARATSGTDKTVTQPIANRQHPLEAAANQTLKRTEHDPVGWETLKNGMALILMIQEKMRQQGFSNDLKSYFTHVNTPDQILGDAQRYTGISPLQFREAAAKGVDAVGALLGLDTPTIGSIKAVVEESQKHEFSGNVIKSYRYGRDKLPATAPMAEILATGLQKKINEKIPKYRAMVQGFESPEPIKAEEAKIIEALKLVDPVQLESLHLQGYEFCYTPAERADAIAFFPNIYGLHRRSSDNPRDLLGGSPKIYFSGGNGMEKAHGTLVHEIAHNIFPDRFSKEQITAMEQLLAANDTHVSKLHHFLNDARKDAGLTPLEQQLKLCAAHCAGNEQEKAAVAAEANKLLAPIGITFEALEPYLQKPELLERLKTSVDRAYMDLRIEGNRYLRSGYDDPSARVREMISRFAELKQVVLRDNPEMLNFVVPQMNTLFNDYYIPHLREVNAAIKQQHAKAAASAPALTITDEAAIIPPTALAAPTEAAAPPPSVIQPPKTPETAPAEATKPAPAPAPTASTEATAASTAHPSTIAPTPPVVPPPLVVPPPKPETPPVASAAHTAPLPTDAIHGAAKDKGSATPTDTVTETPKESTIAATTPVAPPPAKPLPTAAAAEMAGHAASCHGCAACSVRDESPDTVVDARTLNPQGIAANNVARELAGYSAAI